MPSREVNMTVDVLDMYISLAVAVTLAGGNITKWEILKNTSVEDFFNHMASNGIRFVWDKPNV